MKEDRASWDLHTSKRMHFIEEVDNASGSCDVDTCIRQNVCTSLRTAGDRRPQRHEGPCIRQNVCTSLRTDRAIDEATWAQTLHTSKRMHFIEEPRGPPTCTTSAHLHTSKRMHFIEDSPTRPRRTPNRNLHTSKRMHFIEEQTILAFLGRLRLLAYVKTYALH